MSEHLDKAKQYHREIRKILLQDWDPIGVSDIPEAQDEYDSYIGGVYSKLIRQVPKHELIDYLWEVETKNMGLYGSRSRTVNAVKKLIALRKTIE